MITHWRVYNLAFPQTKVEQNRWMIPLSYIGVVFGNIMMYALAIVILLRTLKMYQNDQKHWFRIYTIIMTVLLTIGFLGSAATIPSTFALGVDYTLAPMYRLYVLFTGVLMIFPLSIHMVIAAFNFLFMIYSARGFTLLEFFKDWILKQDGFRYIILLGLNLFNVYSFFVSLLYGQNDTTVLMYSVMT
jgi:small-conductance mechanosensitive channel